MQPLHKVLLEENACPSVRMFYLRSYGMCLDEIWCWTSVTKTYQENLIKFVLAQCKPRFEYSSNRFSYKRLINILYCFKIYRVYYGLRLLFETFLYGKYLTKQYRNKYIQNFIFETLSERIISSDINMKISK
jgi:hypothetical protein